MLSSLSMVRILKPKVRWVFVSSEDYDRSLQDQHTPLHMACQKGSVDVVSALLKAGADIRAPDVVSVPAAA
jgi:ankyrin repeat protein